MDSFGFVVIGGGMFGLMALERIYPDRNLKEVNGWWPRVVIINTIQLFIVVLGTFTWEQWLQMPSLLNLRYYVGSFWGGVVAYLINTWLFYWWHFIRHECYLLWLLCHQLHHSPQRIETATSFYKHPMEILLNSIIMTFVLSVLGLEAGSGIWLSIFSSYGEYFYHMNIATPQWIGYIFQRPESHRIHHLTNKRINGKNFSDFPLFDILGGTFANPSKETKETSTGFSDVNESKIKEMMSFQDVLKKKKNIDYGKYIFLSVLVIGCLQPFGYIIGSNTIRGIGFMTAASPLPLVFSSYNGYETFSNSYVADIETNNETINIVLNNKMFSDIAGPYNRRNVYGAIMSHGPFFDDPNLIKLRQHVFEYAICKGHLNFGFDHGRIHYVTIFVKTRSNDIRIMSISCLYNLP